MKLRAYLEQKLEALGFPAKLEFELDSGGTIELTHPWLWDGATQASYDAARTTEAPRGKGKSPEPVNVQRARAALGKEQYERFAADGGNANMIVLAIEMMQRSDGSPSSAVGVDPKGS